MLLVYALILVVILIIVATTAFKLHPFLALLLAGVFMGFFAGLGADVIMTQLTEGFGNTLKNIGIVIACGTVIGTFLERSGGARTIAGLVLRWVGEKRSPLAMNLTGYIVSIPVFCDSGFVILATLNKALSKKTGISLATLAVALASGLYATHVFVPPTPGPLAAAATLGADIGLVILLGLLVSLPVAFAGLIWAKVYCRRFNIRQKNFVEPAQERQAGPNAWLSFAPLIVPILLIALRSVASYPTAPFGEGVLKNVLTFIGHPVTALIVGVFLAFFLKQRWTSESYADWVSDGLKNAGAIILITGAGGAFGSVLQATGIGDTLSGMLSHWNIGIFLPFIVAAVLKSSQGSSTVAIITTAALLAPMLDMLDFSSPVAKALTVLAIGAGSMTVSHVNDSYYWVVAQFSDMDTVTALRCHTVATLLQGIVGILVVAALTWLLV